MESRLKHERQVAHIYGFIEGVQCTKEILTNELKDAVQTYYRRIFVIIIANTGTQWLRTAYVIK